MKGLSGLTVQGFDRKVIRANKKVVGFYKGIEHRDKFKKAEEAKKQQTAAADPPRATLSVAHDLGHLKYAPRALKPEAGICATAPATATPAPLAPYSGPTTSMLLPTNAIKQEVLLSPPDDAFAAKPASTALSPSSADRARRNKEVALQRRNAAKQVPQLNLQGGTAATMHKAATKPNAQETCDSEEAMMCLADAVDDMEQTLPGVSATPTPTSIAATTTRVLHKGGTMMSPIQKQQISQKLEQAKLRRKQRVSCRPAAGAFCTASSWMGSCLTTGRLDFARPNHASICVCAPRHLMTHSWGSSQRLENGPPWPQPPRFSHYPTLQHIAQTVSISPWMPTAAAMLT